MTNICQSPCYICNKALKEALARMLSIEKTLFHNPTEKSTLELSDEIGKK
jgi:hypothetical protein